MDFGMESTALIHMSPAAQGSRNIATGPARASNQTQAERTFFIDTSLGQQSVMTARIPQAW